MILMFVSSTDTLQKNLSPVIYLGIFKNER
jgi:hypothetical protein